MKLLFLDIDGVLNSINTKEKINGYNGIDNKKVKLQAFIIKKSKAKIILTSTWKDKWFKENKEKQDELANYLDYKLAKCNLTILDKTIDTFFLRDEGIKVFLLNLMLNKKEVIDNIVILDDDISLYADNDINTNIRKGLTLLKTLEAIKKLNSKPNI